MTTFSSVVAGGGGIGALGEGSTGCFGICGRNLELWEQDDLSQLPACLEACVGLLGPAQLERLGDRDRQASVREVGEHLLLDAPHRDRLLLERARAQRGSVDARALLHQEREVDLSLRPCASDADHGDATARAERLDVLREVRGAHELEHYVEWARLAEALRVDGVRPELLDLRAELLVPDRGGYARAGRAAELHRGGADAAGRAVYEQMLARPEAGLREHRVMGGGEHLGQAARRRPVERLRHRHGRSLVHHRQLRLAAAAYDGHHAITLVEALRTWAERLDLTGELEAGYVRGRPGRRRIRAPPLQHVGAVQPRGPHADEDLALPGLRIRALADHQLPVLNGYGPHLRAIYPGLVERV